MNNGKFIISLDFELFWGMRDGRTVEQYGENVIGVNKAIPRLLTVFNKYQIKATFATVGFLFFRNKAELLNNLPEFFPSYLNKKLSPYSGYFDVICKDAEVDIYHFAPHLISLIQNYPEQEIGTHTFSHYYCLEEGQSISEFKADIESALTIAAKHGIKITSLVFPRNQFNDKYLQVCNKLGIICYRGNENSWIYKARNGMKENSVRRAVRLIDAYINLSGHNCYSDVYLKSKTPVDIPSSRFLRPYSGKLKALDLIRLNRIQSGMTYAAKNHLTYHLWWHPHNFGINQDENFSFLEKILEHYTRLNTQFNFQSYTMSELAKIILSSQ
jgi:peptidoglycan/xylan/chitin deacetylase (PgdA/CDA1 family)